MFCMFTERRLRIRTESIKAVAHKSGLVRAAVQCCDASAFVLLSDDDANLLFCVGITNELM